MRSWCKNKVGATMHDRSVWLEQPFMKRTMTPKAIKVKASLRRVLNTSEGDF